MGATEIALIANALLFLVAVTASLDVFDSGDSSSSVADQNDDTISPLFDAADYTETFEGTEGDDNFVADPDAEAFAFFLKAGNDLLNASSGTDFVQGGSGNDSLNLFEGNDIVFGEDGNDEITGGRDDDVVFGGDGDDILSGDRLDSFGSVERGIDSVSGGTGNDTLLLAGADTGTGGSGDDLFVVFNSEDKDSLVEITDFVKGEDSIELRY